MSRFFSNKHQSLVPYVPGEQPQDKQYIKLNTNESPFPPHPSVTEAVASASERLHLYSDPTARMLTEQTAKLLGVTLDEVLMTNGSDEALNFAFMAFCDAEHPVAFPNITYGFYKVFANLHGIPYAEIPLDKDLSVKVSDYIGTKETIFLANPNAPTGIALPLCEIERIVASNPDRVVVIDEAYVDFGGESAVPLIRKYENLLVVQTFSKSRSMAGARLGFAVGCPSLIRDLNTIKYSTNPYNVNAMTQAAGLATLKEGAYTAENCKTIIENREETAQELREMGFALTDSRANFLFAAHDRISGRELYEALRKNGILVRHFDDPLITHYNRITIGTRAQMRTLTDTIRNILKEKYPS